MCNKMSLIILSTVSLIFPLTLIMLLFPDLAQTVLVDEDVREAAGQHDSEELNHGQD